MHPNFTAWTTTRFGREVAKRRSSPLCGSVLPCNFRQGLYQSYIRPAARQVSGSRRVFSALCCHMRMRPRAARHIYLWPSKEGNGAPDDASPSVVCAAGTLAQPPGRPAPVAVRLEQTTRACEARRTALASCSAGGLDCIDEVDKREDLLGGTKREKILRTWLAVN